MSVSHSQRSSLVREAENLNLADVVLNNGSSKYLGNLRYRNQNGDILSQKVPN